MDHMVWNYSTYFATDFSIQLQLYLSGHIKIEDINNNLDDYIECGAAAVDPHSGELELPIFVGNR